MTEKIPQMIGAMFLYFGLACAAQAAGYQAPKILDYDELMELTTGARAEYMLGLQDMLEDFEALHSDHNQSAAAARGRKLIATLLSLQVLPQAQAISAGAHANRGNSATESSLCPVGNPNYYVGETREHGLRCYLRSGILRQDETQCPNGHENLGTSWFLRCALPKGKWNVAIPANPGRERGQAPRPQGQPRCPSNYLPRSNRGEPGCALNDGEKRTECPPGHERSGSSPEADCMLKDPSKAVPLNPRQDPNRCKPQQCNNTEAIEDLKERAYPRSQAGGGRETKCINAGVVTSFDFNRRVCPPVLKLEIAGTTYTCQPGQTLCMPLVFGVDAQGKGICVPISHRTTRACDQKRAEGQNNGQWKDLMKPEDAKTREAWNKWAEELTRLCVTNEDTGVYHCTECGILAKHVSQLNQLLNRSRGQVCGRPNPEGPIGNRAKPGSETDKPPRSTR